MALRNNIARGLAMLSLAALAGTMATSQASAFMGGGHFGGGRFGGHMEGGHMGGSHFGGFGHTIGFGHGIGYDGGRYPGHRPPIHFPHYPHFPVHWPGGHCGDFVRCHGPWPHPGPRPGCHSGYDCGPIVHHCNWWNHWCRPVLPPPVMAPPQPVNYGPSGPAYGPPPSGGAPAQTYSPPPAPAPAPVCATGPMIKIVFQTSATAGAITEFLKGYNLTMGDGPSPDGIYQIKLPTDLPQDQVGQLLDAIRQQTAIVSSVAG